MRRLAIVAVLLLASSAAFADRHPGAVRIGAPAMVFVPHEQVASICGTDRPVDACTRFDELLLTCDCEQTGSGWSTRSKFSAATSVVLAEPSLLLHELTHVQDFRSMIGGYLKGVDAVAYTNPGECQEAARLVQATFAARLDEIRRLSASRRDRTPVAGTVRLRRVPVEIATAPVSAEGGGETGSLAADDEALQPYRVRIAP